MCCCDDEDITGDDIINTDPTEGDGPWNLRKMSNDPALPVLLWRQSLRDLAAAAGGAVVAGVDCNGTITAAASSVFGVGATATLSLLDVDGNLTAQTLFTATYTATRFVQFPGDIYAIGGSSSGHQMIHWFDSSGATLGTLALSSSPPVASVIDMHATVDGVYLVLLAGGIYAMGKRNPDLTFAWSASLMDGIYLYYPISVREAGTITYVTAYSSFTGTTRLFTLDSATGAVTTSVLWTGPQYLCKGDTGDLYGSTGSAIERYTSAGGLVWSSSVAHQSPASLDPSLPVTNSSGKVWYLSDSPFTPYPWFGSLDSAGAVRYGYTDPANQLGGSCIAVDSEESVLLGSGPRYF